MTTPASPAFSFHRQLLLQTAACMLSLLMVAATLSAPAFGQERPARTQMRTNVPPELVVSFSPEIGFDQFVERINTIVKNEMGKPVIDPQGRTFNIGVKVSGMHYLDAFEKVLQSNGLTYTQAQNALLIQKAQSPAQQAVSTDTSGEGPPATIGSRAVRINAVLFSLNLTAVRDRGLRWDAILGSTTSGGGGGGGRGGGTGGRGGGGGGRGGGGGPGGGGGGQGGRQGGQFMIETDNLFKSVDDVLEAPEQLRLSRFRRFLNLVEQNGMGRTIANPQVTVQNRKQGQIQVGQDVPVQTTDFAGNTVTEFVKTGIIINVTPTLLSAPVADTSGAPIADFVHLDVRVEDSNSQPSPAGTIINRNTASTQTILLDQEATVIGGLISTQKTKSRSGVPFLKDLPGWFLGLRYIFGTTQVNVTKQELLIVLEAEAVEPIPSRYAEGREEEKNLLRQRRRRSSEAIDKIGVDRIEVPEADSVAEGSQ